MKYDSGMKRYNKDILASVKLMCGKDSKITDKFRKNDGSPAPLRDYLKDVYGNQGKSSNGVRYMNGKTKGMEAYRVENSPVLSFFKECCVNRVTAVDNCTRSMLYRIFKEWCKDNNCYAPNQVMFRQEISSYKQCDISELEKTVMGKRYYKFTLSKEIKEQYAYIYGNDNTANHTGYH